MRFVRCVLPASIALALPGAAIFFGCNGHPGTFPSSADELPNKVGQGAGSGTGSGTTTTTTTTAPVDLCTCALSVEENPSQACADCANAATASSHPCYAARMACTNSGACQADIACKSACTDATCIAQCVSSPTVSNEYLAYLACTCGACKAACPVPEPCPDLDGGTDAADG
jgi:hypothetical protein